MVSMFLGGLNELLDEVVELVLGGGQGGSDLGWVTRRPGAGLPLGDGGLGCVDNVAELGLGQAECLTARFQSCGGESGDLVEAGGPAARRCGGCLDAAVVVGGGAVGAPPGPGHARQLSSLVGAGRDRQVCAPGAGQDPLMVITGGHGPVVSRCPRRCGFDRSLEDRIEHALSLGGRRDGLTHRSRPSCP